jgi:bacterioferritin-associated ferredoxin
MPMAADTETVLISRCICKATPFSELLGPAREHGWTLTDVIRETGCGGQCGLCRPYISRMLRTGETEFHEIITEDYP